MNKVTTFLLLYSSLLTLAVLSSCRTSRPPPISLICIGDGFGGGDCVTDHGEKVYKSPTELKNFWMTPQDDEARFASWCYKTDEQFTKQVMNKMQSQMVPDNKRGPQ